MCHGATFISQIQPVGGLKGWESVLANLERVEEEGGGGLTKISAFLIKPLFGLIDGEGGGGGSDSHL